jgi:FixJ family two-component response regulator
MTARQPTVFVVDDDASVRDAIGSLMRSVGLHVQLFPSAAAFLKSPPPAGPACVLLDVRMPGLSGLDCQRQLTETGFPIPIIFMSGHGDVPMTVQAMKAGAADFLTKPFRDQELLDAVQQALVRDGVRREADESAAELRQRLTTLSAREREVMEWVVSGKLNKQIAGELGVSEITVKVHRGHVMRKMGADSLAALVRIADRVGIAIRA